METVHEPVLLHEVIEGLTAGTRDKEQGESESNTSPLHTSYFIPHTPVFLDGTLGGAGHALAIAKMFGSKIISSAGKPISFTKMS